MRAASRALLVVALSALASAADGRPPAGAELHLGGGAFRAPAAAVRLRFSADEHALIATTDDALRVLDATSGEARLDVLAPRLRDVVVSADAALAAGSDPDSGLIRILDTESGKRRKPIGTPDDLPGRCAAFSPDGALLVTVRDSPAETLPSLLRVWDVATLQPVGDIAVGRHPLGIVAFSPDGEWLAAGTRDGALWVWKREDAERYLLDSHAHAGAIGVVSFAAASARVVTAGDDGFVRVWDFGTKTRLAEVGGHEDGVVAAGLSPDGALAVSVDGAGYRRRFDSLTGVTPTGRPARTRLLARVGAAAISRDATRLALAEDAAIHVFDAGERKPSASPADGHAGAVREIAFSPDGGRITSVGPSEIVHWDVAAGRFLDAERLPARFRGPVPLSRGGERVALAPGAATVEVLRVGADAGEEVVAGFDVGRDSVTAAALALSPDGETLALAHDEGWVRLWDVAAGEVRLEVPGLWGPKFRRVAFSPDGSLLVVGNAGELETVRVIDARSGESLWEGADGTALRRVALLPDGKTVVLALDDGRIELWNHRADKRVRDWQAHDGPEVRDVPRPVEALAVSPDGRLLATGGHDAAVRVWQTTSGRRVREFTGTRSPVTALAFAPDGKLLAAGLADGSLLVWKVR